METMNILISSNDQYVCPLTVLLQSLFENETGPVELWFLRGDLNDENSAFFKRFAEEHGAKLHYVPVGQEEFRDLPRKSYISRETGVEQFLQKLAS